MQTAIYIIAIIAYVIVFVNSILCIFAKITQCRFKHICVIPYIHFKSDIYSIFGIHLPFQVYSAISTTPITHETGYSR